MVTFRLPDFRLFHLFRDRRQKTSSGNVFPQYPGQIPEQWHQSQSQSGQHPVYFNSSNYFNPERPEPWNGSTSHPSQPNPRTYPSQIPSQYQQQQYQQTLNRHSLQTRPQFQSNPQPQTQPQTSRAAQPYFYPNGSNNPHPGPYYHNRNHRPSQDGPQDNHKPRFPDINTPFNHPPPNLFPGSVQTNAHQALTPHSNVSRVPTTTSVDGHQRRSRSQRSTTRVQATSKSVTARKRSASNAPQIKSRMLEISLVHPLVCGYRHSLIPDQIPETEIGKSERSVWDNQQFSLPEGSQIPMMIDAVQVCSLSLDWDITLPPSHAKEIGRNGQLYTPPRHLHLPLINAKFKSEVCIKTRQDNPLTKCFLRWGCIIVESRDPNGITPTMKQFLYDIWDYFHTPLTEDECSSFTGDDLAKLRQIAESRSNHTRDSEPDQTPFIRGKGPTRRDVLWGYTRFSGLEVCPRFADTGDLFLYLEAL